MQSYGEFRLETQASLTGPSLVILAGSGLPAGTAAATGQSKVQGTEPVCRVSACTCWAIPRWPSSRLSVPIRPGPTRQNRLAGEEPWRASLILRRRTAQGQVSEFHGS